MAKREKTSKKSKNFPLFLKFLWRKKIEGINFLLAFLVLILLPARGYYSQVQAIWQSPKVQSAHFVIPPLNPIPKNITGSVAPQLSAKSAIVVDVPSGIILYQKDPGLRLLPASTTKIMTAMVVLEGFLLDQVLEVPDFYKEGQNIELQKGEKLTVESLLDALLVASANDAAEVFAANYPGGREKFIERMNKKAEDLNLFNTHFVNPTGIDEEGQYSSAADLARLAKMAIQNPKFIQIVSTQEMTIYSVDQKISHQMTNINSLLGRIPGIRGIKTGWTEEAGECFVGFYEKDNRQIITVVLGSQDRFGETVQLIDWVFKNFGWEIPA